MTQNAISPTYRTLVKANNITVWHIESSSGHTYQVTLFESRVTSCVDETGASCKGFHFNGSCHHAKLALAREDERKPIETSQKGTLNGSSQGFSLMR